jgi:hypothetical protein
MKYTLKLEKDYKIFRGSKFLRLMLSLNLRNIFFIFANKFKDYFKILLFKVL